MLPLPNWDVIWKPHETPHQTRAQLEQHIDSLTEELQTAREVIKYQETQEEANSTMLVVQDLTLQKLNESLHSKENKKAQRSKVFAGGKGRHLTHHVLRVSALHYLAGDRVSEGFRTVASARALRQPTSCGSEYFYNQRPQVPNLIGTERSLKK